MVVAGLIITVLSAMAIAGTIHKHVQSMREITYLTWEIVYRIVTWADVAFVPSLDNEKLMIKDLVFRFGPCAFSNMATMLKSILYNMRAGPRACVQR